VSGLRSCGKERTRITKTGASEKKTRKEWWGGTGRWREGDGGERGRIIEGVEGGGGGRGVGEA